MVRDWMHSSPTMHSMTLTLVFQECFNLFISVVLPPTIEVQQCKLDFDANASCIEKNPAENISLNQTGNLEPTIWQLLWSKTNKMIRVTK